MKRKVTLHKKKHKTKMSISTETPWWLKSKKRKQQDENQDNNIQQDENHYNNIQDTNSQDNNIQDNNIGWVVGNPSGEIIKNQYILVKQYPEYKVETHMGAFLVHNITNQDIHQYGTPWKIVENALRADLSNVNYIVEHNSNQFDQHFILNACDEEFKLFWETKIHLNSFHIAKQTYKESHSLDSLVTKLLDDKPIQNYHNSFFDAYYTYLCFQKLWKVNSSWVVKKPLFRDPSNYRFIDSPLFRECYLVKSTPKRHKINKIHKNSTPSMNGSINNKLVESWDLSSLYNSHGLPKFKSILKHEYSYFNHYSGSCQSVFSEFLLLVWKKMSYNFERSFQECDLVCVPEKIDSLIKKCELSPSWKECIESLWRLSVCKCFKHCDDIPEILWSVPKVAISPEWKGYTCLQKHISQLNFPQMFKNVTNDSVYVSDSIIVGLVTKLTDKSFSRTQEIHVAKCYIVAAILNRQQTGLVKEIHLYWLFYGQIQKIQINQSILSNILCSLVVNDGPPSGRRGCASVDAQRLLHRVVGVRLKLL